MEVQLVLRAAGRKGRAKHGLLTGAATISPFCRATRGAVTETEAGRSWLAVCNVPDKAGTFAAAVVASSSRALLDLSWPTSLGICWQTGDFLANAERLGTAGIEGGAASLHITTAGLVALSLTVAASGCCDVRAANNAFPCQLLLSSSSALISLTSPVLPHIPPVVAKPLPVTFLKGGAGPVSVAALGRVFKSFADGSCCNSCVVADENA